MSKETTRELIGRIDQNIVRYPRVMEENFGDDSNLVLSLLSFMMTNLKNDLFNSFTFKLSDFCAKYGYDKKNLHKRHPIFVEQAKELPAPGSKKRKRASLITPHETDGYVWDKEIDHVLYRMMKENIVFKEEVAPGAKYLGASRSLQLFKSVRIRNQVTRAGREEFVYEVTLGNEIFLNSLRWYVSYKEKSFIELGRNKNGLGRRAVYLYLLAQWQRCLVSKIPTNEVNPNFDMLCKLARLTNKKKRNNKEQLIGILDKIGRMEHLNFTHNLKEIDLDDPGFKIRIRFADVHYFEDIKSASFFEETLELFELLFRKEEYKNDTEEINKDESFLEKFQLWINSDSHTQEKAKIIVQVFKKTFGREIPIKDALRAIKEQEYWQQLFTGAQHLRSRGVKPLL